MLKINKKVILSKNLKTWKSVKANRKQKRYHTTVSSLILEQHICSVTLEKHEIPFIQTNIHMTFNGWKVLGRGKEKQWEDDTDNQEPDFCNLAGETQHNVKFHKVWDSEAKNLLQLRVNTEKLPGGNSVGLQWEAFFTQSEQTENVNKCMIRKKQSRKEQRVGMCVCFKLCQRNLQTQCDMAAFNFPFIKPLRFLVPA